ncbi:hypothetical protein ACFRAU_07515 [Arthrobacter sp. NPDC056691]|uniref:hypothetical protein n=1 Tax=Arthrobacter sp. NPDC056691 TaxID=3345913 RepID=UPI00366B0576
MTVTHEQERASNRAQPQAAPVTQPEPKSSGISKPGSDGRTGMFVRLSSDDRERAKYWSGRHGFASVTDYVTEAVLEKIQRENLDYDLPTLEIARLNQLVDELKALSTNQANLERVITQGFDSIISLTRGDTYLLDPEDGEL